MNNNALYFLKISGTIASPKQREFQQTIQFIFNHLPIECLSHNLTLDVNIPNLYHFYSIWQSEVALMEFKFSHEFELLNGAFRTLGAYHHTMAGKQTEAQLFDLNHLDN
jgi:hypothetical protein